LAWSIEINRNNPTPVLALNLSLRSKLIVTDQIKKVVARSFALTKKDASLMTDKVESLEEFLLAR